MQEDFVDFKSDFWSNKQVLIDSRKLVFPKQSLFFAIKGKLTDGHAFLPKLYEQGVRAFVISDNINPNLYPDALFYQTNDVVKVLQKYAAFHRSKFSLPILAITGSNAKTSIKEWLYILLEQHYRIIKSPKSYNSQIGVPLSVLGMNESHELAIFEAGISEVGEMQQLQQIIRPSLGLFTNIGKAHASGFMNQMQKIEEKLLLFQSVEGLIYCSDHEAIHQVIQRSKLKEKTFTWGKSAANDLPIRFVIKGNTTRVHLRWQASDIELQLPFSNRAAIENCLHCIACLLYLGIDISTMEQNIKKLRDIPMRLEMKQGINNCQVIDDSYNNDLEGLKIALDFLKQKHKQSPHFSKTLILSDIPEAKTEATYRLIAKLVSKHQIQKLIGIGPQLKAFKHLFKAIPTTYFFEETTTFIQAIDQSILFQDESILLKGARAFEFERIAQQLKNRIHGTVLEINLNALTHNLQVYKNQLNASTQLMVMVKASAYGSGSYEIAQLLEYHKVDYLGVAYVDEGVALRKKGIQLPIMVMNTAIHEFETLCSFQLEPVVYSFNILERFLLFLKQQKNNAPYPIHLELDTGMHRLGFGEQDLSRLIELLAVSKELLHIQGIFSHLAASDENQQEDFSWEQIKRFQTWAASIESHLNIQSIKHILNSAGISRFPNQQMNMVRLGIGLYGLDPNKRLLQLQAVVRLKTTIAQIKTLDKTETVGYGRQGTLEERGRIAILSIGYADGFLRTFGNGAFSVQIRGQLAPTIGRICMDMCFVDIKHLPNVQEGDEVLIFDSIAGIEAMAQAAGTIPYEILTNISDRVPRIFYED